MGNYYKGNRSRRWYKNSIGGGKKKSKKKKLFFGSLLLLLAVCVYCTWFNPSLGNIGALKQGKEAVVSVVKSGIAQGKALLNGDDFAVAVPVSSGVVVENFGVVTDAEGKAAYHNGIDIRVPAESEVLAAADGKISDISTHEDGTVWITVAHQQNWSTVYGRLGQANVAVGDEIKKGDVLGTPANEILHFEVLEKEIEKDPVQYFETGT